MNKLIPIEQNGQRVITTELLAKAYETDTKNLQMNFSNHKEKFVQGIHYFELRGDDLKAFKASLPNDIGEALKFAPVLYLWTERGANRHCKILDTPKAWEQFDNLEETYFAVKEGRVQFTPPADDTKRISAEAKLNNSRARVASLWLKIANVVSIPEYKDICASRAGAALAGKETLALPTCEEHLYTATEIGEMLGGIDKAKIGRIANLNGLKTQEYGKTVWDKSPYSNKQVESFRYNEKAVERFRELTKGG